MGVVKEDMQIKDMQMDGGGENDAGDREQKKRIICFGAPHKGTCQTRMKRKASARPGLIYGYRDQTQTDKCALRVTMNYGG